VELSCHCQLVTSAGCQREVLLEAVLVVVALVVALVDAPVVVAVVVVLAWVVCLEVEVVLEEVSTADGRVIVGKSWLTHKTPIAAEEIRSRTGMRTSLRFDTLAPLEKSNLRFYLLVVWKLILCYEF